MRIGIDFDNTIACYRTAFHGAAAARGLVPPEPVLSKNQVRDHLRRLGCEDDWTALQGYVYGPGLADVDVFPGLKRCLRRLVAAGAAVFVISHKTRTPYRGPAFDLHAAARDWLERQGFFHPSEVGLSPENIFFELTLRDKLRRIATQRCTHFVDDLAELLAEPEFPGGTERILFDPDEAHVGGPFRRPGARPSRPRQAGGTPALRVASWAELESWLNLPSN